MNLSGRNCIPLLAACGSLLISAGCKQQDSTVEALKQENAALRKQAQDRATNEPLTNNQDTTPIGSLQAGGNGIPPNSGNGGGVPGAAPGAPGAGAAGQPGKPGGPAGSGVVDPASGAGGISHGSLPDYPGAAPDIKGRMDGHPDQAVNGMTLRMLITPVEMDDVIKFYDQKLTRYIEDPVHAGSWIYRHPTRTERGTGAARQVRLSDAQADGSVRAVVIKSDSGKTYIELMEIAGTVHNVPNGMGAQPSPPQSGGTPAPDPLAPTLLPNKSGGQ